MILKEEGYGVDWAGTGQGALDTLSQKGFDLLVADLRLPDMDGMEVIKQVREKRPEIKVIVITGYANVPSVVKAMKAGVVDYLPKPFTDEEFMAKVEWVMMERQKTESEESAELPGSLEGEKEARDELSVQPHVLLMEDESSVAQGLYMILTEEGYDVDLAKTGQSALDILSQKEFDLLVADLRLPDMDGTEVIKLVKKKQPKTEVIAITGYGSISSAVETMKAGATEYLPKPFTEEEFMTKVEKVIDLKERKESRSKEVLEPVDADIGAFTRLGFYICHCGDNIDEKVCVKEVVDFAHKQPTVVVARDHKQLCLDPGLEMIEKDIKELGLNRVVVAACKEKAYEEKFRSACRRSGIKPKHVQITSMREQVAWITQDPVEATMKAKTLATAAIYRANYHQAFTTREVSVHPDVLVVGGGIAGMQASLDIAKAGHNAYLVEKAPTIGGRMLQFDKTFPTLDCAACIGTPKMVEVGQNPNIQLMTCSEVVEISGFVGNFKVKIRKNPRYIDLSKCTGCGECAKACPVKYRLYSPEEKDLKKGPEQET